MTDARLWRYYAEEHGRCLVDFIAAGASTALLVEQTRIAAHFARLWMAWLEVQEQYRLADERASFLWSKCEDKYRPEGTERGEPFDMEDVVD